MTSYPRAGFFGRLLAALGGGLARGLLGQSAHAHLKQFTGSDEYWDRVIEAQRACHRDQPRGAEPGPPGGPRPAVSLARAAVGDTAGIPPVARGPS